MDEIIIEATRANRSVANLPTRTEVLTDEIDEMLLTYLESKTTSISTLANTPDDKLAPEPLNLAKQTSYSTATSTPSVGSNNGNIFSHPLAPITGPAEDVSLLANKAP